MTLYFADTAAIAKRYVPEVGSSWIRGLTQTSSGHVFIISEVTTVEMAHVLAVKQRDSAISPIDVKRLFNDFLWHAANEYLVVQFEQTIVSGAQALIFNHVLRTMDAVQLASCSRVSQVLGESPVFLSADARLNAVAVNEGFVADDPLKHP